MLSQPFGPRNWTLNPNRRASCATLDHQSRYACPHLNLLSEPKRSLDQHFPDRIAKVFYKKNLDLRTRRTLPSNHARRQHFRIVDHEEIAGLKKLEQIAPIEAAALADAATKEELLDEARSANVEGASSMTKADLAKALAGKMS